MKTRWFDLLNIYQPKMSFPGGLDQDSVQRFLKSVSVDNSPASEFAGYVDRDWRRFVYTWMLCRDLTGACLEIGASPYFTTALLKEFTGLELVLSNYSSTATRMGENVARWISPRTGSEVEHRMVHDLFNVETDPLRYPDDHFDVILFCEVVEHLTNDPLAALMEIRRVLKPGGKLILSTPNSASARNILKIVTGKSVYDRYSAYGPYGRHNREYTKGEMERLLDAVGFSVETAFTANVLFPRRAQQIGSFLAELYFSLFSRKRARALGQYMFVSSVKRDVGQVMRPDWLFRSYANREVVGRTSDLLTRAG